MHFFLSYPRKDTPKALQLKEALFRGGHIVWMDDQLITGQSWHDQLEAQIKEADAIALAVTPNWVNSPYCQWEFITAVENGKKVIPVLLEKTSLPNRINKYQYADLSDGFADKKVQKLLDDLVMLAQTVNPSDVSDIDKEQYTMRINQNNQGGGHNIHVSGNSNTIAGGDIDQSHQSINIGGSVSGGNVNIGGKQIIHGNVTIQHDALESADVGSPLNELKVLLQELETALNNEPTHKSDDIELAQKYANEVAVESARDEPRQKWLEVSGEGLTKAAENLFGVMPIVAKIVQKLLMLG